MKYTQSLVLFFGMMIFILETNIVHSDDTYAKDRIKSARLKLNGINPAVITGYEYIVNYRK